MSLFTAEALRYQSQRDFISALGNARNDKLILSLTRPQHGQAGRLLISALASRDGSGPRPFSWRIPTSTPTDPQVEAMILLSTETFLNPFM